MLGDRDQTTCPDTTFTDLLETVPLGGHGEKYKYCKSKSLIREKSFLFLENEEQSSLSKRCILDQSQAVRAQGLKEEG